MYAFSQRKAVALRESGAKPERPRHCNRDETAKPLGEISPGRRGSRMNGSQETGLRLRRLTYLRGRVWPVNREGGASSSSFPFSRLAGPPREAGAFFVRSRRVPSAAGASQAASLPRSSSGGLRQWGEDRPFSRAFPATEDVFSFPSQG